MAKQEQPIYGRVVAITGGARGIGRATAAVLAREGARVAIGDLDLEAAQATASELQGDVSAYELNVTDRGSFERFVEAVESDIGPLDVLVNNAGIMQLGSFTGEEDAAARRMIDINVHGVLLGMKIALPGMLRRNRGHVVNIASAAGKGGFPGGATYSASKHAVVGVTEAVRAELRETPLEFSIVMPAVVNTELASGLKAGRMVQISEPEDVAAEIVSALKRPRVDVWVPRSVGPINKLMMALPRGAREAVARFLKADKILTEYDDSQRAAYEQRAADSEPQAGAEDVAAGKANEKERVEA